MWAYVVCLCVCSYMQACVRACYECACSEHMHKPAAFQLTRFVRLFCFAGEGPHHFNIYLFWRWLMVSSVFEGARAWDELMHVPDCPPPPPPPISRM